MPSRLSLEILPQPDDTTCGPTCLHAVYGFHGLRLPLDQVIREVVPLESRGTLAVLLACHALEQGFRAVIYTYNLHVFDPSWFRPDAPPLADQLRAQAREKTDQKLQFATEAYLRFLSLGGELRFRELTTELIRGHLRKNRPILTGLSATYLYGTPREIGDEPTEYDSIRGTPAGHFVVLCGYDPEARKILVADPLLENPHAPSAHHYWVGIQRVLGAILLGVLTYDANFLVVKPLEGT